MLFLGIFSDNIMRCHFVSDIMLPSRSAIAEDMLRYGAGRLVMLWYNVTWRVTWWHGVTWTGLFEKNRYLIALFGCFFVCFCCRLLLWLFLFFSFSVVEPNSQHEFFFLSDLKFNWSLLDCFGWLCCSCFGVFSSFWVCCCSVGCCCDHFFFFVVEPTSQHGDFLSDLCV